MATLNKKGISPIIATILLMMMVVAAAGGMFFWMTRLQGQQQGGVESSQSKFFTVAATQANIMRASYNDSSARLDIFVQNIGNNPIPVDNGTSYPTTEWIIFDSSQRAICSANWGGVTTSGNVSCLRGCGTDISIGQIRQIGLTLNAGGQCSILSQPNGSRISFTIDFSGKTTAGGSLDK